jgi:hypothetical protein
MKKLLGMSVLAALCAWPAAAQENYAQWLKFKNITVNTKASGANVTASVAKFPVLVRLDSTNAADVFTGAQAGGADLRFTNLAGTVRRAHQIETWDAAGKTATIWVLADTVKGNDSTASLRLYWGKAGAADSSNGAAVFDTANGFQGVWHLGEATGATANDATVNKFHGTPGNTGTFTDNSMPFDTAGVIGRGKSLRMSGGTSGAYFVMDGTAPGSVTTAGAGNVTSFAEAGPYTLSLWVRVYNNTTSGMIITKGDGYYQLAKRNGGASWEFIHSNGTRPGGTRIDIGAGNVGVWKHVAGVRNATGNTGATIYVDGAAATYTSTTETATLNQTFPLTVGRDPGSTATRYLTGAIDEVTVATRERSADWLKLTFETQKPAASAVMLGATQNGAAPTALSSLAYGDSAKAADTIAVDIGVAFNRVPTYLGGPADSIKVVSGTLPAGLTVNKASGALSGTATAVTAASNVVIRAWGHAVAGDSASRTVRVSAAISPLANLHYSPDTTTYTVGVPVSKMPTYTGRAATKFKASSLPAGLSLDSVSGQLSGTPTAVTAAANYTVTATNTAGPDTATRVLRLTIAAFTAEDYTTWNRHKTLWLNTTATGANVSTLVQNFPVLVRFTTTDTVYAQMLAGTADLRFTKSDNATRLPHQVETWDSAGKSAAVWVLVDSVQGNNGTQNIRMHWGKAGAPNLSSGPAVFDTAKGFRAVFHFSERTNDTALNSTQYTFRGIPQRTATAYNFPVDTAGAIGRARAYGTGSTSNNSAGSYFTVNGSAAPLDFAMNGPYTLSLWAYVPETGTSRTMVSKSDRQYAFERRNTGADWEFTEHNLPLGGWQVVGTPSTANVWAHLIGVRNNGKSALYLDGVLMDTIPSDETNNATTTARITTTDLNIGRSPDGGTNNAARYYWRGMLDEVRVSSVSRSAAWARLEFENQKAAQTLVSPTQPVGIAHGNARVNAHGEGLAAKAMSGGVLFQLFGAPQGGKLALMDVYGRTIWSGAFPAGVNHLVWNGTAANGQTVSGGVYLARVTLNAVNGKPRTLEMKVPFTP